MAEMDPNVDKTTGAVPQVRWDDGEMGTSYANVCNVTGTREEVTLLFGTNQTGINERDVSVALSNRVVLSPFAAKRLGRLLENVLGEYEKRFGKLEQ